MRQKLLERFIRYVKIWTESNEENADKGIMPSSEGQWDLANILLEELMKLGLSNCIITKNCYTYGMLKATPGYEDVPGFCLLAHVDTSPEVSGKNVNPIVVENSQEHNGETIIKTDGTTLLGADDKAGVAEIVTSLEYLKNNPQIPHPQIEVIFSPDEETGHGMDKVPLELIQSKFAYTVDGGHIGELETECFNAAKAEITFAGKASHTGTARGNMVNAVLMASSFVSSLPRHLMPETTDGYTGFYAPLEISGNLEQSFVYLLLRDFDEKELNNKKQFVNELAELTAKTFGGTVKVEITDQYKNMKNNLDQHPEVVSKLVESYKKAGVEPVFSPIRGGTDGSRLTELGIPCPNIFTGGHNFHSKEEWASLDQMMKTVEILINLMSC